MKIGWGSLSLILVALLVAASSGRAAPSESVESACASSAFQKVEAFLSEQIVAAQLEALGMSRQQAQARLSRLSEAQLQALAAQVDLIQAGGTIQRGHVNVLGPVGHVFRQLGTFLVNVYRLLFSWAELK